MQAVTRDNDEMCTRGLERTVRSPAEVGATRYERVDRERSELRRQAALHTLHTHPT